MLNANYFRFVSRDLTEMIKIGLLVGTIAMVFMQHFLQVVRTHLYKDGQSDPLEKTVLFRIGRFSFNLYQSFTGVLIFVAAMASFNYITNSHLSAKTHLDEYDLMHYYVTPKYFDELGYYNLLPALIVADNENIRHCASRTHAYLDQSSNGYVIKPISYALSRAEEIKKPFTKERWAAFTHDMLYLQRVERNMGCGTWTQLLYDHGFNGTPVWMMMARPLTQLVPIESIRLLVNLDIILVILALIAVGWAFGFNTALFALLFFATSYSTRWPIIGWAFLRYDWVASMVIGICMLKKEKFAVAGGLFAYSALMRYFPAVFMLGIAAKMIHTLVINRRTPLRQIWKRIPLRYYKITAGYFAVTLTLLSLSFARDGFRAHEQSFENMASHVLPENLSSRRMGLVIGLVYQWDVDTKIIDASQKEKVAAIEPTVRLVSIGLMILLGLFMTRLSDSTAVGLGFLPYFWLTTSSYYYYVILITGVVIHAAGIKERWHMWGLFTMFAIQFVFNAHEHFRPGYRTPNISTVCWVLIIYSAAILIYLGQNWWRTRNGRVPSSKGLARSTEPTKQNT